jgi:hypothetical protein
MKTVRVCSVEQLLVAVGLRPTRRIELALPAVEPSEARVWEERINDLLKSCGCGESAAGLLGGFGVALTAVVLGWPVPLLPGATAAVVTAAAVLGAVAGTIAGKVRGRRGARRQAMKLVALLAAPAEATDIRAKRVAS